jgi:uncharacterized RDD family membrane protein YckC
MISQPVQLPPPPPPPGDLPPPPPPPAFSSVPAWQNPAYAPPPPDYLAASQVRYAGFWIRFAAIFIDGLILFVAYFVISFVLGFFIGFMVAMGGGSEMSTAQQNLLTAISWIVSLALNAGYFSYQWAGGSTIGMRRFGLRVVDATTGGPIGLSRGFIRWLGYMLSVVVCYVGLIWAAFDPRKQGWHDKIANTVVVQG